MRLVLANECGQGEQIICNRQNDGVNQGYPEKQGQ